MQLVLSLDQLSSPETEPIDDLVGVQISTVEPAGALELYVPDTGEWRLVMPDEVLSRASLEAGHVRVFVDGFQAVTPSIDFVIQHSSALGEPMRLEVVAQQDSLAVNLIPLGALEHELSLIEQPAQRVMSINEPLYLFEDPPTFTVQTQQHFEGATLSLYTQKSQIYILNEKLFLEETSTLKLMPTLITPTSSEGKVYYQGESIGTYHQEQSHDNDTDKAASLTISFQGAPATLETVYFVMQHIGYENTLSLQSREIFTDFQMNDHVLLSGKVDIVTNNPPITSDHFIEMDTPAPETLKLADFNYYDSDGDAFDRVQILQTPLNGGELQYDASGRGTWLKVEDGAEIPAQAIRDGHLRFVPNAEMTSTGISMFEFSVSDGKSWSDQHSMVFNTKQPVDTPDLLGSMYGETFEEYSDFNMITAPVVIPDVGIEKKLAFNPMEKAPTAYGSITVNEAGLWSYSFNEALPELKDLASGDVLEDKIPIIASDGRVFDLMIRITGEADGPKASLVSEESRLVDAQTINESAPGSELTGLAAQFAQLVSIAGDAPVITSDQVVHTDFGNELRNNSLEAQKVSITAQDNLNQESPVYSSIAVSPENQSDGVTQIDARAELSTTPVVVQQSNLVQVLMEGDYADNLQLLNSLGDHAALTQTRELTPQQINSFFVEAEADQVGRFENTLLKTAEHEGSLIYESKLTFSTPEDSNGSRCDLVLIQKGTIELTDDQQVNQSLLDTIKPSYVSLHITGDQQVLDLTALNSETLNRIDKIELGSRENSANHLSLTVTDVLNLGHSPAINDSDSEKQLIVSGDARDSVTLRNTDGGVWQQTDDVTTINEQKYSVYHGSTAEGEAKVLINVDDHLPVIIS